ncbi:MAG: transcriptional regulator [Paenibacillaceae bacterium]|jgi:AcrR family transcriptional regulator|nr:transcriptional regulator [Paenibacillaceae bacterium]
MNPSEQDARQAIIEAAKALLDEAADIGKITVRQIAQRAGVGTGLINYHFQSKDNLLSIAIGDVMSATIQAFTTADAYSLLEPVARLKEMMKELYTLAGSYDKLIRFILSHEIMDGRMQTPLLLLPLLKEIFGSQKDDLQLRTMALQILYPIQVTALHPDAFHLYSGINLSDPGQRSQFVDVLIDNLTNH